VAEESLAVLDGARHDHGVGVVEVGRRLGDDRDTVVAERGPNLLGDRGRHPLRIELSDDRAGDLAQDRELHDAERLLRRLAARRFFELAGLRRQVPHLLDQVRDLPAGAQVGPAACERAVHHVLEILAREGLDEVLEGAVREGVPHGLERRVGRDHHDLDRRVEPLDVPEELEPVHLGHLDVHDHDVWLEPPQQSRPCARSLLSGSGRRASAACGGIRAGPARRRRRARARARWSSCS